MTGYTRQSTADIIAGQIVSAQPVADEFNQLEAAFNSVSGHSHDASTGNGPKIILTTSVSGILPAANGGTGLSSIATFVTLTGAELLKNKSLEDVSTWFVDDLDNTKRVRFKATSITTGTTRILTVPNFDGTIATLAGTEIFTNKTLDGVTVSGTLDFTGGTLNVRDDRFFIVDNADVTKRLAWEVTNIPTSTTRTIGAPNASGTLVTLTGTDTLTNKSLDDVTTFFTDNSDATKKFQFQASGITTATTRTYTVPNFDGTLATLAGTETFTGKTYSSGAITGTFTGNATFSGTLTLTRPVITLQDTTTTFQNNSDNTKQAVFNVGDGPTGTTRTFFLPFASKTLIGLVDIQNYLSGLTIENNVTDATNDINIYPGTCMDSTNFDSMTIPSLLTKRLDAAWAVGTNAGGRDTGAIADATWHVFVIKRIDTGVVDVLFSQSPNSPTMPSPYTLFRRIGSIMRTAGVIVQFIQDGDVFTQKSVLNDVSVTNPGTSAVLGTLLIPVGIRVQVFGTCTTAETGAVTTLYNLYISDPSTADVAPTTSIYTNQLQMDTALAANRSTGWFQSWTNTSAQVRYRISGSIATTVVRISSKGWIDQRGR